MPTANKSEAERHWILPPRFLLFVLAAAVAGVIASILLGIGRGWLVGFDVGAVAFLLSTVPLLRSCTAEQMRRRAEANEANRAAVLTIMVIIAPVVLGALALELAGRTPAPGVLAFVVVTLILTWLFMNTVFALHYAHMYYDAAEGGGHAGGIDFPETPDPGYWDFFYFSYCLGMTFQTSDSNLTQTRFRRVVTAHCMLAFVFGVGVIAFTVNVLGGAGGGAGATATH